MIQDAHSLLGRCLRIDLTQPQILRAGSRAGDATWAPRSGGKCPNTLAQLFFSEERSDYSLDTGCILQMELCFGQTLQVRGWRWPPSWSPKENEAKMHFGKCLWNWGGGVGAFSLLRREVLGPLAGPCSYLAGRLLGKEVTFTLSIWWSGKQCHLIYPC